MNFSQLFEMPLNIKTVGSFYNAIKKMVDAAGEMEVEPIKVAYNIYKIVDQDQYMLYYYMENNMVISGVFLSKIRPGMYKISMAGKHPSYIGRKPYTIDVYRAIINDLKGNEALLSDDHLTDDSIKIWKRLVKELPGRVSVYDKNTREITPITNVNELGKVFGLAPSLVRYQFMVRGQRETTRIQELAGIKKETV